MSLSTIDEVIMSGIYKYNAFNYEDDQLEQQHNEMDILKNNVSCQQDIINKFKHNLQHINSQQIASLLYNNFYDPNVMKVISCLVSSIITYSNNNFIEDAIIHQWFSDPKIISTGSLEGNVISTSIYQYQQSNNVFVIKSPKVGRNLLHELFIGLYGINSLRNHIPNFAYTLGGFSCSSLSIVRNNILTWCNPDPESNDNIILENIYGINLRQYIINYGTYLKEIHNQTDINTYEDYTITYILLYYLQILFSINIASKEIQFTHHDLHSLNVILRDVKVPDISFFIPYQYKNKTIFLYTNKVATIIDFGFSRIEYNNKVYSLINSYKDLTKEKFPLNDAYHLLIDIMYNLYYIRISTCVKLLPILQFFIDINENQLDNFFKKGFLNISYLPYNNKTSGNLEGLIDYIIENAKMSPFLTENPDKSLSYILRCDSNSCRTPQQIQEDIFFHTSIEKNDIFSIYQSLIINQKLNINSDQIEKLVEQEKENFNILISEINQFNQFNEINEFLIQLLNSFNEPLQGSLDIDKQINQFRKQKITPEGVLILNELVEKLETEQKLGNYQQNISSDLQTAFNNFKNELYKQMIEAYLPPIINLYQKIINMIDMWIVITKVSNDTNINMEISQKFSITYLHNYDKINKILMTINLINDIAIFIGNIFLSQKLSDYMQPLFPTYQHIIEHKTYYR